MVEDTNPLFLDPEYATGEMGRGDRGVQGTVTARREGEDGMG